MIAGITYNVLGWQFSTDELVAWGTPLLVLVGFLTFWVNWQMTKATKRAADAAIAQVTASYPMFDVVLEDIAEGAAAAKGRISWLQGSLPAVDVQIWVRASSYLYCGRYVALAPGDANKEVKMDVTTEKSPFRNMPLTRPLGKPWKGLLWQDPSGKTRLREVP